MDGFNEKKWFIYLGDHHEGPFSLAEIQQKMTERLITSANYVWAEGMPDWKQMPEVPAFQALLAEREATSAPRISGPSVEATSASNAQLFSDAAAQEALSVEPLEVSPVIMETALAVDEPTPVAPPAAIEPMGVEPVSVEPAGTVEMAEEPTPSVVIGAAGSQSLGDAHGLSAASPFENPEGAAAPRKRSGIGRAIKVASLPLVMAGAAGAYVLGFLDPVLETPAVKAARDSAYPYLVSMTEYVPGLENWISPIPALDDVAPEEYEELKLAAGGDAEQGEPKVALALSRADQASASFYVASNLPDGARFDVYVEGNPDTLLSQTSFSAKTNATVTRKIGKTAAVRMSEGKLLVRGEYTVYVVEADQQSEAVQAALAKLPVSNIMLPSGLPQGKKLVSKRVLFLGGERDEFYRTRLKEFHDSLKAKATTELTELRQFAAILDTQYATSMAEFSKLSKVRKLTRAHQQNWNTFHGKWIQIDTQLSESYQKWTPEVLQNDYFYGTLYAQAQMIGQAVTRLHGLHHAYFTGTVDGKSFEVQRGETMSQIEAALTSLKSKLDLAESLKAQSRGVPRREGL